MKQIVSLILSSTILLFSGPECANAQSGQASPMQRFLEIDGAVLDVDIWGSDGETIVALPGLASDTSRFHLLAPRIVEAGYRFVAVNSRGIRESAGSLEGLSLEILAQDVANVVSALDLEKAHLLGWAFGNRITRATAAQHPEVVATVTLLAAGGKVPPSAENRELTTKLRTSSNLSVEERTELRRAAYYSPATDIALVNQLGVPASWPAALSAQISAARSASLSSWWSGGRAPLLVIQGLDDQTAVPENGRLLKQEYPDRVDLVEIEDAGHVLPIEKPDRIASVIAAWLRDHAIEN